MENRWCKAKGEITEACILMENESRNPLFTVFSDR